jgi:hypothetical protein
LPDTKLDNLKRWTESGQPGQWLDAHSGEWGYSEWMALLDDLKTGPFWPMSPDDIGAHLESLAKGYRQRRHQILNGGNEILLANAFWWYLAGLAVVGVASGFFAGASHTAIIGTLLPLLFALIGGTSGIYIANADLTSPALAERLRWLGRALASFGVACLIGSAGGILLRLHYERPYRGNELSTLWHGRAQESLQLAALRTKLRLLGVSPDEESAILAEAAGALNEATQQIPPQHVREVSAQARQLQAELKALRDKATAAKAQVPEDAEALITQLDLFCHQTEPWADSGMPRDLYKNSVETVFFHLSHIAMPHETATAAWIHQTGFDTRNLYKLFASIDAEFRLRDDLDWEMGGATSDHLDKFLELAAKNGQLRNDAEEILPAIDMNEKNDKAAEKKRDDQTK